MLYQMQVVRVLQQDCVTKPVLIGEPVSVFGDCLEEAQQKAASEKLVQRHNRKSTYHSWLIAQRDDRASTYNSAYAWAVDKQELVN